MRKVDIQKLNEEIDCTGYAIRGVRGAGNEVSDIASRIDTLSNMVEEGLLDEDIYKDYVCRQKREIKDLLAKVYSFLNLNEVKGRLDGAFKED